MDDSNTFTTAGIVGGIATVGALIGGAIGWWLNFRKMARKDLIAEYRSLLEAERIQHQRDLEYRDRRILYLESSNRSLTEIKDEALETAEHLINEKRRSEGKVPLTVIAPVVGEHASPLTMEQAETAKLATDRARATATTLEAGLPARKAGVLETDEQRTARLTNEQERK